MKNKKLIPAPFLTATSMSLWLIFHSTYGMAMGSRKPQIQSTTQIAIQRPATMPILLPALSPNPTPSILANLSTGNNGHIPTVTDLEVMESEMQLITSRNSASRCGPHCKDCRRTSGTNSTQDVYTCYHCKKTIGTITATFANGIWENIFDLECTNLPQDASRGLVARVSGSMEAAGRVQGGGWYFHWNNRFTDGSGNLLTPMGHGTSDYQNPGRWPNDPLPMNDFLSLTADRLPADGVAHFSVMSDGIIPGNSLQLKNMSIEIISISL